MGPGLQLEPLLSFHNEAAPVPDGAEGVLGAPVSDMFSGRLWFGAGSGPGAGRAGGARSVS